MARFHVFLHVFLLLGRSWNAPGRSWNALGALLGPLGSSWGALGALLERSWVLLGRSGELPEPPEPILKPPGPILGSPGIDFRASGHRYFSLRRAIRKALWDRLASDLRLTCERLASASQVRRAECIDLRATREHDELTETNKLHRF